jgi:tetratricopeptide (TPR) repeat protein
MATKKTASAKKKSPTSRRPSQVGKRILTAIAATVLVAAYERLQRPATAAPMPQAQAPAPTAPAPVPAPGTAALAPTAPAPAPAPAEPAEPHVETPEDPLALAHTHGRRVNHLARARALREEGDLSGAFTESRRALHDEPEDEEALLTAARLAKLTGRTELAATAYERLGRLRADDAEPLVQQARLLLSLRRLEDTVRVGEEALARDPEVPEAYHLLGLAHLSAGRLDEAILRFQQAVHLHPEHGYALNNLGYAYLRANQNAKAAEVLARAAGLLPNVAYVHNNLGVAYERLGRAEEARAAYSTATLLSPRYVKARVNVERMNKVAQASVTPSGATAEAISPEVPEQ